MEWIIENDSGDEKEEALDGTGETKKIASALSYKCEDCNKCLRNDEDVQMHSARTGHVNYSESSDSVSPLTEDERKQQMEKLQELLRIKKVQREEQEKHEEFEREKKRRQQCKTLSSAKAKFEEDEIRRLIEQKKREKEEDRAYREKLKAEIAREQEEKRAREAGESLVITSNSAPVSNTAPKINPTICRLQIRLPSGQPIKGEFGVNEPLSAVTLYVSQNWPNSSTFIDPQSIHLMTNFPKQEFTDEDMSKSLLDLDFHIHHSGHLSSIHNMPSD
ncbi:UBX domain-containing protein 1-A [Schistosoma japonicum]|nr:UBX domain-containing protein 1-A [Schistosoma japonicum]